MMTHGHSRIGSRAPVLMKWMLCLGLNGMVLEDAMAAKPLDASVVREGQAVMDRLPLQTWGEPQRSTTRAAAVSDLFFLVNGPPKYLRTHVPQPDFRRLVNSDGAWRQMMPARPYDLANICLVDCDPHTPFPSRWGYLNAKPISELKAAGLAAKLLIGNTVAFVAQHQMGLRQPEPLAFSGAAMYFREDGVVLMADSRNLDGRLMVDADALATRGNKFCLLTAGLCLRVMEDERRQAYVMLEALGEDGIPLGDGPIFQVISVYPADWMGLEARAREQARAIATGFAAARVMFEAQQRKEKDESDAQQQRFIDRLQREKN